MSSDSVVMPGTYVADGVVVESGVSIGPNAVVLAAQDEADRQTTLRTESVIGANATVLPSVEIGRRAQVAPGAVVTTSVPPLAMVEGNPAHIAGYVDSAHDEDSLAAQLGNSQVRGSLVRGVTIHRFTTVSDMRGRLSAAESGRDIPFQPSRIFMVYRVPSTETRGAHAHRRCQQFLIAAQGQLAVVADDGETRQEFLLDSPSFGLYLPAMTWGIQYKCSSEAVLLVLASDPYDPDDYIRDYAEFVAAVEHVRPAEDQERG